MNHRRASTFASLIPLLLAFAHFALHMATTGRYGMFRDEYYYWDCANHLAWGYVDHPPLSIAMLAAWKSVFGDSLLSLRILPALAGAILVLLVARLAGRLGAGPWARAFAAVMTFAVPSYLGITGVYSMNAYELLFWAAGYLLVLRVQEHGRTIDWLWLGVCIGFGMLNKVSAGVFAATAGVVLLAESGLRVLRTPGPYVAVAVAAVLFAPHVLWQVQHDWPTREFIANAQRYKMTAFSPLAFLGGVAMEMGPTLAPLLALGLVGALVSRKFGERRTLAWIALLALAAFTLQRSKPYYAVAAFPPVIAATAIGIESLTRVRLRWLRGVAVVYALISFALAAPLAVPILPVERLLTYLARLGMRPSSGENRDTGALPQFFADRFGWRELEQQVAAVVRALPESERMRCAIVADNYGQAGAINYYGRRDRLPRAVCQHNNYYLWGYGEVTPEVYVIIGQSREDLEAGFDEVREVARTGTPYAMPDETDVPIWVCRRLRIPLDDAWRQGKKYI